ncbi:MAG: YfcE family phosphodiesterase [Spirochaetes bacterium]|nr:YfcE family phosphodiesterase [Spirochaetota bacterium]
MKVLVISDSHGNINALRRIFQKELPCDVIIHCGDGINDLQKFEINATKLFVVAGNMDGTYISQYERRVVTDIGKFRFYIAHGDLQRAHDDYAELYEEGQRNSCDIVVFGHTHKKYIGNGKPILFNPGPALNGLYGVILIGETLNCAHRHVDE